MTVAVMEETSTEVEVKDENAGIHPFLIDLMGRIDMKPTFKSERGLLYSIHPEQRFPDRFGGAEKTIQYEVLIKPETVTLRIITETCGVNPHSQKIYRSWKTDRILNLSLKAEKHGHRVLRIYETITKTKKYSGSFTNATARYSEYFNLTTKDGIPDYFEMEHVKSALSVSRLRKPSSQEIAYALAGWAFYQVFRKLDPTNPAFIARSFADSAAYPIFQLFPNSAFNVNKIRECLPKNYSLHSELDVKKFITKAFGADGVRKDMVKAVVSTTDIGAIFLVAQLKTLFPLDWLRDVMKAPSEYVIYNPSVAYTEAATRGLFALLSSLTLPQRKRLLLEKTEQAKIIKRVGGAAPREVSIDSLYIGVKDSVRMFSGLNPEQREEYKNRIDYSSWESLHDTLIQVTNEIRTKEDAQIHSQRFDLGDTYMTKLNTTSYEVNGETYNIFAPKHRHDLNRWGNEMHNCIASYHRNVQAHNTNVFGIYHNDALFANVEISNDGRIVQHMQKYNSPSPQEHFDALAEHIKAVEEKIQKKKESDKRIAEAQKRRSQRQLAVA